ncbi:FKBP-type peptidyl-prolyl cis-trans isomerase [Apibacter mensalis]|uniref:FKBP-type peptidyl-prolyl cis-trans isomerase n=1 Tax=Apibacter mensalis TaxID=1586267 RepID=UPI0026F3343F|nr:FKBP-type peptidyl-prolyl cis-trans isomerase [Apibacter mensalis]
MKFLNIAIIYSFCIGILFSCQKKEIFLPVTNSKSAYGKKLLENSKAREDKERDFLQNWISKREDSLHLKFVPTSSGIWIRFISHKKSPQPKNNSWIKYSAEIKTLSGDVIYSFDEFGEKQGVLGKFKEIRGIESALYMMEKGDIAEIVLPSFSAYGLYGDENKIGSNVPLLVTLTLIDIKPLSKLSK